MAKFTKKERISHAIIDYGKASGNIIELFESKQDLQFEFWCGEGFAVACISDLFIDIADIIFDLETEQPKGRIVEWYSEKQSSKFIEKMVNYPTYCKTKPRRSNHENV
jgi:hypothetical protein